MSEENSLKERDKVIVAIIQNYEKISPYNKGRLSMMAEMLGEKYPEEKEKVSG